MIHPAPTTPIAPTLARGLLIETATATATKPAHVVIEFPNTSYEMHLIPVGGGPITTPVGKRIVGEIHVQARRVDIVETGGKYVEPVYGRPRRVQGRVVATDPANRSIIVDAGMAIHLTLTDARQTLALFNQGDLVSCDVLDGATFKPC